MSQRTGCSLNGRALSRSTATARTCIAAQRPGRRVGQVQALFGWGKKPEKTEADWDREDQWELQKELLRKRKSGEMISEAEIRRKKVQATVKSRKDARQAEKDALAQGVMPESLRSWKNYDKEAMENGNSGIVVPLLPFGLRKYDEGERFDLRSPYSDDGWVDPDEVDVWGSIKNIGQKLLNFKGEQPAPTERKKVIWAKNYGKYMAEQKAKMEGGGALPEKGKK